MYSATAQASIADGREKNGIRMPAWREVLTDQDGSIGAVLVGSAWESFATHSAPKRTLRKSVAGQHPRRANSANAWHAIKPIGRPMQKTSLPAH